jgi:hypothetical protein
MNSQPAGSLAWASDPARLAGSSPATWAGLGPARKKNFKKLFQKICDFPKIFYFIFYQYWFVFLYCKDTNLVLKYPIFVKTLKNNKKIKNVLFSCIRPSLSKNKK